MRLSYFFCFLFLLWSPSLSASHIIGGEVTYECLGSGRYLIEFHLYRDCREGNAGFDDRGVLTYFICDANGTCLDKVQSDGNIIRVVADEIRPVTQPDLECLVAPVEVCVEEAIYRFEIDGSPDLFTPMVDSNYVIVFQRCCRNETIINIDNPDRTGSSYVVEIIPPAQATCNNSPVFNNFPPTLICNNQPINFDHSASDSDGDSLVYSFCSPLVGGGIGGSFQFDPGGDALACDGAGPEPACPNFYEEVPFISPAYTAQAPMGGDPVVSIDPATGLITGTPRLQGQFVVGVCVEEYRNGQFMGRIQRDFQFNVVACIQNVTAQIVSDEVRENFGPNGEVISRDFNLTVCGQDQIEFINESFDRSFISEIQWEFEGATILSDAWNAEVMFPTDGDYEGKLILNPNSPQCIDSANIFVKILPEVSANFGTSFDSCTIGPVMFTDSSEAEGSVITTRFWDFADGNGSSQQNPIHQYSNSGNYNISLTITDENGCTDTKSVSIDYSPAPQSIAIDPNAVGGCEPMPIIFNNNSTPIGEDYTILWDFGDGNTASSISPTHVYEQAGTYSVSLSITSPIGCQITRDFDDLISILPAPTAGFTLSPEELSSQNPTVQVSDNSRNADTWLYDFSGQGTASTPNASFTFRDTGTQQIVQIVTADSGCRDTAIQLIDIIPFVEWFMPNAFSPTRDGINDVFIGNGFLAGARSFNFSIWNRWGENVFETTDYQEGWNGRKNNTGKESPAGVYVYLLSYRTPRGDLIQLEGFATLIR